MKEMLNFILTKYYEKLTDLQYKYDDAREETTTEEGEQDVYIYYL